MSELVGSQLRKDRRIIGESLRVLDETRGSLDEYRRIIGESLRILAEGRQILGEDPESPDQ